MNKWQVICPLVALTLVGIVATGISARRHYRGFVVAQTCMIGQDLIASKNSHRLVGVGSDLQARLGQLLLSAPSIADVLVGDQPAPIGDGTASSRLILSNANGERLGIRLRQMREGEGFRVLGYWTIAEPIAGPASR